METDSLYTWKPCTVIEACNMSDAGPFPRMHGFRLRVRYTHQRWRAYMTSYKTCGNLKILYR